MYSEENVLQQAIRKTGRYGQYLDNNEYFVLMKYASVGESFGSPARNAIATAVLKWGGKPFEAVSYRNVTKENAAVVYVAVQVADVMSV